MSSVDNFSFLNNLTQVDYIKDLLNKRLPEFYPDFVTLKEIEIRPYKKHFGKTSATYVAGYFCKYENNKQELKDLNIFVSAHTDGSRQDSFANNSFLYAHGFARGQYLTPKPLFYVSELGGFFYEGVRGRILKKLIKDEPQRDLRPVLDLATAWLRVLHNIDSSDPNFRLKDFSIKNMRPRPDKLIADFVARNKELGQRLENLLQGIINLEVDWSSKINKTLVHGDYHLENIVVSGLEPDHIKVIDFTDLAWGDPCLDLGEFLQQFDFMLQNTLSRQQINDYKSYFIESYFGESFADIDPVFISRINLYQAWTTLRTVALLFYTKDSRHALENLLKDTEGYLELSQKQIVKINLN